MPKRKTTGPGPSGSQSKQPRKKKPKKTPRRSRYPYTSDRPVGHREVGAADCIKHYAWALADPISCPLGVCIPSFYSCPSFKLKWSQCGTLTVGSDGIGYFGVLTPGPNNGLSCAWINDSGVNETLGGYFDITGGLTAAVTMANLAPSYSIGDGALSAARFKLVACGVKIQYCGVAVDRGGTIHQFTTPGNNPVNSDTVGITYQNLIDLPTTTHHSITDKTYYWTYFPQEEHDYDLHQLNYGLSASAGVIGGFIIDSTRGAGGGGKFKYEIAYHWEVITSDAIKTASHSAPEQFAKVITKRQEQHLAKVNPTPKSLIDSVNDFFNGAMDTVDKVSNTIDRAMSMTGPKYQKAYKMAKYIL